MSEIRRRMIEEQLRSRGVSDPAVLGAMMAVPRESFVAREFRDSAYDDSALPIAEQQTISQPYIVAVMAQALLLHPHDRVLEVGTGSGYAAAVLARLCAELHSIEWHGTLATLAAERLRRLGADNVRVHCGDGSRGWPDAAPFDAITVAAGAPRVPEALKDQLALGGRLVLPVGRSTTQQSLIRITRRGGSRWDEEHLLEVRFVPLMGEEGWRSGNPPSSS